MLKNPPKRLTENNEDSYRLRRLYLLHTLEFAAKQLSQDSVEHRNLLFKQLNRAKDGIGKRYWKRCSTPRSSVQVLLNISWPYPRDLVYLPRESRRARFQLKAQFFSIHQSRGL